MKGASSMKFILLIYHNEERFKGLNETERQELYDEYGQLRERVKSEGQYVDGSQLQFTSATKTIQIRDGKELVTDGPFAETHEQLGGYLLVDVKNIDEAIAIGKQIPSLRSGIIEVRPLVERAVPANA
jgi:hypothetical protein